VVCFSWTKCLVQKYSSRKAYHYRLYPGWYLAENPKVHYIAWWDKSTARPYGHVAYVQWKSGANTLIKVNEMTWQGNTCANEPVTKYISLPSTGEPTGYIVR
jgi:surface antigen